MLTRRSLALAAPALFAGLPARGQAAIEMVITNEIAATHWSALLQEDFARSLAERTGGRIRPRVFHGGTLYKDREAVTALGSGTVHMVWPVSVQLEGLVPAYGVVNLPFALTDDVMLREGAPEAIAEFLSRFVADRGIRVLGLLRAADMIFLFRDRAVETVAALRGAKVRVTGGRTIQALMRRFGASPVSMPASEMATALMQGAIDGIYTSAGGWGMVGPSAAGVATLVPGLNLFTYSVLADARWLEGLPADLRRAVLDHTAEFVRTQWRRGIESDREALQQQIGAGGRLVTVSGAALEEFRAAARDVNEEFIRRHPEVWREYSAILARFGA